MKFISNQELKLTGAVVVPMQIEQTNYIIEAHTAPDVMLDFVIGYPTMCQLERTVDCRKHALVVAGVRYSILSCRDSDTLRPVVVSHVVSQ